MPEGPAPRGWRRLHALALGMLAFVTLLWALASLNETNISRRFPALAHVVCDGYRPVERIEGYMVYQRR